MLESRWVLRRRLRPGTLQSPQATSPTSRLTLRHAIVAVHSREVARSGVAKFLARWQCRSRYRSAVEDSPCDFGSIASRRVRPEQNLCMARAWLPGNWGRLCCDWVLAPSTSRSAQDQHDERNFARTGMLNYAAGLVRMERQITSHPAFPRLSTSISVPVSR